MNIRQLTWLPFILAGLMFYPGQGWADSWQNAVSARVSTEFDTNPAMVPAYHGGIWRSIFDPSYTLTRTADTNEFKVGLALLIARSSNKTLSQNREDPSVFLNWRHQGEKGELGISTRYDEVATRVSELNDTGRVSIDSTRATRSLSANWNRALGERSTLAADGAYMDISYQGGTFTDYSTQSGGLKLSHTLSETGTSFLMVSGAKYVPTDGGYCNRLATAILGLNWKVEHMDFTMQIGKSKRSGGYNELQGGVAAQYTGQRTQLALKADRQVSSSGLGGFVKADQMNGSWSYDMSERSRFGVDVGWRKNHSITNNFNRNAGVWLQRDLNSFWGMRTYYQHKISGGDGVNGASSNILGFSIAYTNPDF